MKEVKQEVPLFMMIIAIILVGFIIYIVYQKEETEKSDLPIAEVKPNEEVSFLM